MQNQIFYQFLTLIVTKNKSVPYNLYFYMLNLFCQICIVANIITGWIILGGNFSPVKKVPPSVLITFLGNSSHVQTVCGRFRHL